MSFSGYLNDGKTVPGLDRIDEVVYGQCKITGNTLSGTVTWSFNGDYDVAPEVIPCAPIWVSGASISGGWSQYAPIATVLQYPNNVSTNGASGIVWLKTALGGGSCGVTYNVPLRVFGKANP